YHFFFHGMGIPNLDSKIRYNRITRHRKFVGTHGWSGLMKVVNHRHIVDKTFIFSPRDDIASGPSGRGATIDRIYRSITRAIEGEMQITICTQLYFLLAISFIDIKLMLPGINVCATITVEFLPRGISTCRKSPSRPYGRRTFLYLSDRFLPPVEC